MNPETWIKAVAKIESLHPMVKDIEMRVRRLEKGAWMMAGAFAILEFVRACR